MWKDLTEARSSDPNFKPWEEWSSKRVGNIGLFGFKTTFTEDTITVTFTDKFNPDTLYATLSRKDDILTFNGSPYWQDLDPGQKAIALVYGELQTKYINDEKVPADYKDSFLKKFTEAKNKLTS